MNDLETIRKRFPGICCAFRDEAGIVTTKCFGFADKEENVPVDENTAFPACSISKFITAICVMKEYEQGRIDIDKPINLYLRSWKFLTPSGNESDAPIRSFLNHTSGIIDGEDGFFGLRRSDPYVIADEFVFKPLNLKNTFSASLANLSDYEQKIVMATGYDEDGLAIPGKYPQMPDLAASGLWSTPNDLLVIAKEFTKAFNGESNLLQAESALKMATPSERFPWAGLGIFMDGENKLSISGWGENGQSRLKFNYRTGEAAVVMVNRNPGVAQEESGVEWLINNGVEFL